MQNVLIIKYNICLFFQLTFTFYNTYDLLMVVLEQVTRESLKIYRHTRKKNEKIH